MHLIICLFITLLLGIVKVFEYPAMSWYAVIMPLVAFTVMFCMLMFSSYVMDKHL